MLKNNEPIRVAQIIGKMSAGGVESVVFNYYKKIDKEKVQFDFYYDADSSVAPPKELIEMGARFIKLPPYQNLFQYISALRKELRNNKYIIVHSHLNTLSIFPLFAAYMEKVPVRIAHNHSVPGGKEYKRNFLKYIFRMGAKIFPTDYFACSEKAGKWMFGKKTYSSGKVVLIKNAIDYDVFSKNEFNRKKIREKLNLKNDTVIGHVGRLTSAKNHSFLLKIFTQYKKTDKNAKLLLVGEGELRNQIEDEILRLNLSDSCILVGKQSDTSLYYSGMDIMVMPSIFEGLGLAAIEAQACQLPIVVSEAIPSEAVITTGVTSLSLKDSIDSWVEAIQKSLTKSISFIDEYDEYNIDNASEKLLDWYVNRYNKEINEELDE